MTVEFRDESRCCAGNMKSKLYTVTVNSTPGHLRTILPLCILVVQVGRHASSSEKRKGVTVRDNKPALYLRYLLFDLYHSTIWQESDMVLSMVPPGTSDSGIHLVAALGALQAPNHLVLKYILAMNRSTLTVR